MSMFEVRGLARGSRGRDPQGTDLRAEWSGKSEHINGGSAWDRWKLGDTEIERIMWT